MIRGRIDIFEFLRATPYIYATRLLIGLRLSDFSFKVLTYLVKKKASE
jgi:hypothetical protein